MPPNRRQAKKQWLISSPPSEPLTRTRVFQLAWPMIVANATVPLLGFVETAVIGNTGSVLDLGAIALGALIFNFLYWSFGFLRMGTTGFVAQALGAGDELEVRAIFARALLLAGVLGLALLVLQVPIRICTLQLFHGSAQVERVAARYFDVRLWGAPASLGTLAVRGTLIGLGYTRELLLLELTLNGLNLALDVLFAGVLGWGAPGIALGTVLAEWLALALGLALVTLRLRERRVDEESFWPWQRIRRREHLAKLLGANADIMVRTVLLLLGFAWFTDQSARFGDVILAANHVLLQFLAFGAFFLDGYAYASEALVGAAVGARRVGTFDLAVRRATELAIASAALLAVAIWWGGSAAIELLTDLVPVREAARAYLPWAALYVLLAVGAFQLDGIFIGATRTRDMRNASLASTGAFLLAAWLLARQAGNRGLWCAFILFVIARAVALGVRYPALRRSIDANA